MRQFGLIRWYGEGKGLLVGYAVSARKQIGKRDIYRRQHWDGYSDGYPYFVPRGVHRMTQAQQTWRGAFRLAMMSWNRLPEHEKEKWRRRAQYKPVLGHNLYAKWYLSKAGFGYAAFGTSAFGAPAYSAVRAGFGKTSFGYSVFGSVSI